MALIERSARGGTLIVRFHRPPANAFDLELTEEFRACLEEAAAAPPAGGIVLTGAGAVFSGGVDFKAVPIYSIAERARMIGNINAAITAYYGLPTATVAALNGHAIGGAFVIALASDVRVAAPTARFGLTEITAGIPYPACPMEVVREEIDPVYRRHLVLSGEVIGTEAAHARGLVDEIVEPDLLLDRAAELARLRAGARSYSRVKQQLRKPTLDRMRAIIASGSDPMLAQWV